MSKLKLTKLSAVVGLALTGLYGCGGADSADPADIPVTPKTTSADLVGQVTKGTVSNAAVSVTQLNGSTIAITSGDRTDTEGQINMSVEGDEGFGINSMVKVVVTADADSSMVCDAPACGDMTMGDVITGGLLSGTELTSMTYLSVPFANSADGTADATFRANALTTIATALVEKDVAGGRNVSVRQLYELALEDNSQTALKALGVDAKQNVFSGDLVSAEAYENFVSGEDCVALVGEDGEPTGEQECTDTLVSTDIIKLSLANAAFADIAPDSTINTRISNTIETIGIAQEGDITVLKPLREQMLATVAAVPFLDQLGMAAEDVIDLALPFVQEELNTGPLVAVSTDNATITARNQISEAEAGPKAFDGDVNTKWLDHNDWNGAPTEEDPSWIQVEFAEPQAVSSLAITSANDAPSRDPENFNLQASDDGENWVTLAEFLGETFDERFERKEFSFANGLKYSHYRLNITKNKGDDGLMQVAEIEFFGPVYADVIQPASEASITARGAISDNEAAPMLFDGDTQTKWLDNTAVPTVEDPSWVQVDFAAPVAVGTLAITSANDAPSRDPENFNLQGSNDGGVTWVTLGSWLAESFDERFERQLFNLDNGLAFSSYRFNVTKNKGDDSMMQIAELELIGPQLADLNHALEYTTVEARGAISDNESGAKAFDGDSQTKWLDNTAVPTAEEPAWVEVSLPESQAVNQVVLISANDAPDRDPENFTLQATQDGEYWVTLGEWLGVSFDERFERQTFPVVNSLGYSQYRFNITKNKGDSNLMQIAEIGLVGPQYQSVVLTQSGATFAERAAISDNEAGSMAFDGDAQTKWLDNGGVPTVEEPSWIDISLDQAGTINQLAMTSANDAPSRDPENFRLLGSNDGETWSLVGEWIGESFDERYERKVFPTTNGRSFMFYRVEITKNKGDDSLMQVAEIELIGPQL
ncbi:discoidin domain-containing protein [Lacimicrobium alkaliphilum]|uniref:Coagulation factor 5/8 type protein n=1 Tax=Lacimicrobium alkaliphilum TaxID=1526571 RepID=A0A0U2ZND3_9ALTE|nr:discoidin domain-containing protein [Lacimicrobium alkaliphilum]ALS99788.1 coagulation factor 5/8 type protein [Lacimicrobium alkaliphilum]